NAPVVSSLATAACSSALRRPTAALRAAALPDGFPPLTVDLPEALAGDEVAELAYSLRLVHPRFVRRRPAGWRRYWYRGQESYFDVFIDVDEEDRDQVRWFQFSYRGRFVTWDGSKDAVSTGLTNEFSAEQMAFSSSKLLTLHSEGDGGFIGLVLDVLQHRLDSPPLVAARSRLRRAAERQNLCRRPTLTLAE
ncbi:MAG: hypothetical protein AAFX94_10205, partial [Myxococcota bacterium]